MFKAQAVTTGPDRYSWTVTGPEFLPVAPAEEFLSYCSAVGRSPTTVETYAYALATSSAISTAPTSIGAS